MFSTQVDYFIFLAKKTLRVLKSNGPKAATQKVAAFLGQKFSLDQEWNEKNYSNWILEKEPLLFAHKDSFLNLPIQPKFSFIIPVYNTDPILLRKCFDSVRYQTFGNWEICCVDDCSTNNKDEIIKVIKEYSESLGDKFKYKLSTLNNHISLNSNACVEISTGDYLQLLDNDDTVSPFMLEEYIYKINTNPEFEIIYGDEDYTDIEDKRSDPFFRPDFQPDYLLSTMYFPHFLIKKDLFINLGGFRAGFEGAQDWELAIRSFTKGIRIGHIAKILYHWRKSSSSTASLLENKEYIVDAHKKTLETYLFDNKINAYIEPGVWSGSSCIRYNLPEPLVSIIIANKNNRKYLEMCINSLYIKNTYKNFEIIIVENGSTEVELSRYYNELEISSKARIIQYNQSTFNYSKINNQGVKESKGDLILFLNNDIECLESESIQYMVENALRPEIGAVGAKLLYPNNTVQHAGVDFKKTKNGEIPYHPFQGLSGFSHGGSGAPINTVRNPIAVTAACMMVEKKKLIEAGMFNEKYIIAYQDIDLCLTLDKHGYRSLYHPKSQWKHYESITRKTDIIDDNKERDYRLFVDSMK